MRILLVEDEAQMAQILALALQRQGMLIDFAASIAAAEQALRHDVHDLVLLDRQLPDGDGASLIATIKRLRPEASILLLTARGTLADRIGGLDLGADDYLVKPFATEELLARIRAVVRRPLHHQSTAVIENLAYHFASQDVEIEGQRLVLPRRQLLVLEALCLRHGRTVRRETLLGAVYDFSDEIQSNALDSHISKLRRALLDAGARVNIHVIRGVGYLLKGEPDGRH